MIPEGADHGLKLPLLAQVLRRSLGIGIEIRLLRAGAQGFVFTFHLPELVQHGNLLLTYLR